MFEASNSKHSHKFREVGLPRQPAQVWGCAQEGNYIRSHDPFDALITTQIFVLHIVVSSTVYRTVREHSVHIDLFTGANHEPTIRRKEQYPETHPHQRNIERTSGACIVRSSSLTATQVDSRIESIDVKLAKLTAELSTYQQRLGRMRDGPGKSAIKQKAIKILQQRKMYESQKDQLQQQSWNMEQAGMMQDNLKNTMATVDAMKTTQKELKRQYGKVDIDKIDRLQDEMAELMEVGNDIQESISRSYDVPEDVDEAEALGDDVEIHGEGLGEDAMPGFLTESAGPPQFIDEAPVMGKAKEAAT